MRTLVTEYLNYNATPPTTIYHYCSIPAFINIIEKSSIWLSDLSKTNDSTEMQWLFSNVKKVITKVLTELNNEIDPQLLLEIELLCTRMIEGLVNNTIPITQYEKNFLTCFSEKEDLLSQWRAYGNDGKGVAIGFSSRFFRKFEDNYHYDFVKVNYKQKDIDRFLQGALEEPLKQLLLGSSYSSYDKAELFLRIRSSILTIYQEGFLFKNPNFFEEKEWRLYRQVNISNYDTDSGIDAYGFYTGIEGIFCENINCVSGFRRSDLKFRNTDCDIRLYMELGFENFKKQIINKIITGPKCKANLLDLKLLLAKNGYIDDVTSNNIEIMPSNVPYV